MVGCFVHNSYLIALCVINAFLQHFGQVTDGASLLTIMGLHYQCNGTSEVYTLCDGKASAIMKNNISFAYNDTEIAVWIFARDASNKSTTYQGDIMLSLQPKMDCSNSLQNSCDISFVTAMKCIGNNSMQLPDLCCTFVFNSKYNLENGSQCLFWDGSKFENKLEDWSYIDNCILLELNETSKKLGVCIEKSFGHFPTKFEISEQETPVSFTSTTLFFYLQIQALVLTYVAYTAVIITFIVFRKWRRSNSHLVMLHFSISAIMEISSDIFVTQYNFKTPLACEIVEKIAHYSMLAYLCWLFVQCVLMYMRFVKVLGTYVPYFIWKASLFAWGTPLIFVGLNIAVNAHETFYHGWTDYTRCYYPPLLVVNLFYIMPTGLIIIGNVVIIVMVNKGIYCTSNHANLRSNQSEKSRIKRRLKATFASLMLLGLEWMLYILSIIDYPNYNESIFYRLHCLIGAWTGFAIFLILVLTDSSFKNVWVQRFSR